MSDTTVITDTSIGEELIFDNTMVSKILGVQVSTLRKYCTLMQKYNYEFNKNPLGHRIFYKKDVEMLKTIVDLKNSGTLTLEQAVKAILEVEIDDIVKTSDIATISVPNYNELLEEFTNFRKEQMEFNKQLFEQIQMQDQYIKNSIEVRDKKLMLAIRETQETKRLIKEATEAAAAEEPQKKKRAWWKFWN